MLFLVTAGIYAKESPPSHLQAGLGIFNVDKTHRCGLALLEYRFEPDYHHVRPLVAGMFSTERSLFICAGAGWDIFIGKEKKVVVTPSFAPGVYFKGKGKDLGFPINFRSSIELAYVFENKGRLGAQFFHISNARMLVHNPGVDCLIFFYAIPFPHKKHK